MSPGRGGPCPKLLEHLLGATAQRNKVYPLLVELGQVAVGGQLGIKNQLLGQLAGTLLPKFHETQHLVVLVFFANLCVAVTEHVRVGVLRHKGQQTLLAAAALGNIVFLQ